MKPHHAKPRIGGFTIIEGLVCAVVLFIFATLLLPALSKPKSRHRIFCISNIKQIGLAFRMWSNDHSEQFPWQVSSEGTNGGTKEFAITGDVWRHFQAISNELTTPKIVHCFEDKERTRAPQWESFTNNSHLSYFVGLEANEVLPQTILSGDRDLVSNVQPVGGILTLSTNDYLKWSKRIHKEQGNIGLADGSATQASETILKRQLQSLFQSTSQPVFRLALPQ